MPSLDIGILSSRNHTRIIDLSQILRAISFCLNVSQYVSVRALGELVHPSFPLATPKPRRFLVRQMRVNCQIWDPNIHVY